MFAQLGNIVFTGLYGPSDLNFDGDEANYAEFELVGNKPTIQRVGSSLLEISASINMHMRFCNPGVQLQRLKAFKESGEVLPLLLGNGQYIGDFVIVSLPYVVDDAFDDGTFKQLTVQLSLKEYVSINKLEQKQLAARRSAFAVGDKKPVVLRNPQAPSIEKQIATSITESKQQSDKVDEMVSVMENNPNSITAAKVLDAANKGRVSLTTLKDKLENNLSVLAEHPNLKTVAEVMLSNFNGIITSYPFSDIAAAVSKNTELRETTRSLSRASDALLKKIILRK
jgi:phage protein U